MKKTDSKGFILLETLVATVFVSGILLFLFSQFTTLSKNYDETNKYNNVEGIYALNTISNYILDDWTMYENLDDQKDDYINITDCSLFTNINFCQKLFQYENIDTILVVKKGFDNNQELDYDEDLLDFIKILPAKENVKEKYRLISKFKNGTFATIRFGEENE